jgi:hypothetical protein
MNIVDWLSSDGFTVRYGCFDYASGGQAIYTLRRDVMGMHPVSPRRCPMQTAQKSASALSGFIHVALKLNGPMDADSLMSMRTQNTMLSLSSGPRHGHLRVVRTSLMAALHFYGRL